MAPFDPKALALLREWLPCAPGSVASIAGDDSIDAVLHAAYPGLLRLSLEADGSIPAPDDSLGTLFACHALERLKMEDFYMVCSDARRVVNTGGYWALLAHHPGETLWSRLRAAVFRRRHHLRPLELFHYISPEDWETVREEKVMRRGLVSQIAILRRLPEWTAPPSG